MTTSVSPIKETEHSLRATSAILLMFAAGIVHLVIVPHHLEHAPAHGIALGISGILEIAWAITFWFRPTKKLAQAGTLLAGSLIFLWVLTRFLPAPFTNVPEEVDFAGILSKALETISIILLLSLILQLSPKISAFHTIVSITLVSAILAVGVYEAARASQPLFPQLTATQAEHQHLDEHGTGY